MAFGNRRSINKILSQFDEVLNGTMDALVPAEPTEPSESSMTIVVDENGWMEGFVRFRGQIDDPYKFNQAQLSDILERLDRVRPEEPLPPLSPLVPIPDPNLPSRLHPGVRHGVGR